MENGETPHLAQNGKTITCTVDNSALLVASRLSSYSSSSLSSTSRSKDQSHYSRKLGTFADPSTTRSDKHACGKRVLTDHDKQAMGDREPADETNKEDPTQGILVWLQQFTVNLEDLETRVLAYSSAREKSDSEGDASKAETQKRKHCVHAYFRKNQKRSILRTEKYGDLTTAEHKVLNEGRESRNNHRFAAEVQVLATHWNPCQTKTSLFISWFFFKKKIIFHFFHFLFIFSFFLICSFLLIFYLFFFFDLLIFLIFFSFLVFFLFFFFVFYVFF